MGTRGMGNGVQGYGVYGQWGTRGMGHIGNGSHGQWGTGVWGTWAMRPTGGIGYRGMGTWAIGAHGYGVQGIWAMWAMEYMGNGVQGYEPHGEREPMGDLLPKYQKDVKLSKRCQMSKNQTPRLWRRFTKKLN